MKMLGLAGRVALAAAVSSPGLLSSQPAHAYSTNSVVSDPCHERLSFDAIRVVRGELPGAAPIAAAEDDEQALVDDVPFSVPKDMRDLASVTLVLGNRNVDIKDHEPDDLDALAQVHAHPNNQQEHCLRAPQHDEPDGNALALDACRSYIRDRALAALDGLDAQGMPDAAHRTKASVYLDLRGSVKASLPTYWWEIGRAMHAMQDAFSHTYRSQEDPLKVIAVMNYVEYVEEELDEHIDGPPHSSGMDRCVDLDAFRQERVGLAVTASADLLRATLDHTVDRGGKEALVDQMLTRYLSLQDGCDADNAWCDAPEANYPGERGCVCSLPGGSDRESGGGLAMLALFGGALAVVARRRKRAPSRAKTAALGAFGGLLGVASIAIPANAQDIAPPPEEPPPTVVIESDDGRVADVHVMEREKDYFPFGVHAAVGASIANPGGAASLGLRWRLSEHFLLGADGEYNPFYAETTDELRPGVTNVYATGIVRFPMDFESVNLRSTLNLGISRMNMDLFGVPEGSVGPFIGFNLLGIDVELAKQLYLVINPAYVAIPIPQTKGVPYSYPQYRISLGFQVGA